MGNTNNNLGGNMEVEQVEILNEIEGELIPRDSKGRFPKGTSGNPLGRPEGSKNRATVLREKFDVALLDAIDEDGEFIKVLEAMLLKAKQGDVQAAKLILKDIAGIRDDSKKSTGPREVNILIENYTKNEVIENG